MKKFIQPNTVDLQSLAERIEHREGEINRAVTTTVELAIAQGKDLWLAKNSLPHGEWGNWLSGNFPKDARQARRYMRLANTKGTHASDFDGTDSIRGALRLIALPGTGRRRQSQLAGRTAEPSLSLEMQEIDPPSAVIPNLCLIADWISNNREQIVAWSLEEKQRLKSKLQPVVELYNLLV